MKAGSATAAFLVVGFASSLMAATAALGANARPGAAAGEKPAPQRAPVHITSDTAEFHNKENIVIFLGNVVATQDGSTLTADRVELVFSPAEGRVDAAASTSTAERAVGAVGEPAAGRQIKTITALKNVNFRQVDAETKKERYATGDKAVYDAEQRLVTMTGNPRLWEGRNVIVGEELIFHLEGQDVAVKGKVNLTVFPDDAKPEQKP